jgi:hypothetical protein
MTVDEYGRSESHRLLWREATSLTDLGELMAQWLEGKITYQPAYYGVAPDDETDGLVDVLGAVNRAGLVTTFSQPGVPLVAGSGQRASVDGFCTQDTLIPLHAVTRGTDLVVITFPPGCESGGQVAVTMIDGGECTWLGLPLDSEDIDQYYQEDLSDRGFQAIRTAWQVHIIDPVWGRDDLLWDTLRRIQP